MQNSHSPSTPHADEQEDWHLPLDLEQEEDWEIPLDLDVETAPAMVAGKTHTQIKTVLESSPKETSLSAQEMRAILLSAPAPKRMLGLWKNLDKTKINEWCAHDPAIRSLSHLHGTIRDEYIHGVLTQMEKKLPKAIDRKKPLLRDRFIRQFRKNSMGLTIQRTIAKSTRMELLRDALHQAEHALAQELRNIHRQMEHSKNQNEKTAIKSVWQPRWEWMQSLLAGVHTAQKDLHSTIEK